ncbi:Sensor protein ZraS [Caulifigura coniformis]|uniref:histidine kinase n=1 Tax=Caulifigura coniformis TaxID=2527983 RepID=A0A517SI11_9PLAN|nr:HAMP domain-containing sensor histidine kinase [Caulifigura coniformis]QDT55760.1 Sensor protein ZraS [Caulifigura coniformis]
MMTWSLRNQMLLPLVVFAAILVFVVTFDRAALQVKLAGDRAVRAYIAVADQLANAPPERIPDVLSAAQKDNDGWHFVIVADHELRTGTIAMLPRQEEIATTLPPASRTSAGYDEVLMGLEGHWYYVIPLAVPGWPDGSYLVCLEPYQSIAATITGAFRKSAWLSLAICTALIAAAAVYSSRLSRRVVRIEQQVRRIAAGDHRQMADERGNDEISRLARSVNVMSSDLDSMKRLVAQTERDRLHSQVAGGVAHELRNGIHAARLSLEVFQESYESPEGPARMLRNAHDQLAVTETLVRRLLSLGKKPMNLETSSLPIGTILKNVVDMVDPVCRHAEIRLRENFHCGADETIHDAESMHAAIVNLCLNGVEAIGRRGEITLSLTSTSGFIEIQVSDSGCGPESTVAEQIFEPFVTTKPDGIGLGLVQVRQAARNAGGDVTWTRDSDRTVFSIRVPCRETPRPSGSPQPALAAT